MIPVGSTPADSGGLGGSIEFDSAVRQRREFLAVEADRWFARNRAALELGDAAAAPVLQTLAELPRPRQSNTARWPSQSYR